MFEYPITCPLCYAPSIKLIFVFHSGTVGEKESNTFVKTEVIQLEAIA
jgi:hypothetical protein